MVVGVPLPSRRVRGYLLTLGVRSRDESAARHRGDGPTSPSRTGRAAGSESSRGRGISLQSRPG